MTTTPRPARFFNQLRTMTTFASAASVSALRTAFVGVQRGVLRNSDITLNVSTEFPPNDSSADRYVGFRDGIVDGVRPSLDGGVARLNAELRGARSVGMARSIIAENGLTVAEKLPSTIMSARALDVISATPVRALDLSARKYLRMGIMASGKRSIVGDYMFRRGVFENLLEHPAAVNTSMRIDRRPISREFIPAIRKSTYLGVSLFVGVSVALVAAAAALGFMFHPLAALVAVFLAWKCPTWRATAATLRELREVTGGLK